ncbi:hypothetical protein H0H87_011384 [Tephrocybe sp. NHM501043]|nr:hypothetical protein H0H87_011384 [Tephrocybe sp. NHM501043]
MGARSSTLILLSLFTLAHGATTFTFPDCVNGPLKSNGVCDTSLDPRSRAEALISLFTVPELINNTVNTSPGVPRLGIGAYEWWSEALPILIGAAFDDDLTKSIAASISTEARAFNNAGRAGLDFWTPNINPFKDPRWGRGQETPGEDPYHISQYVLNLIEGLQGGIDPQPHLKVAADCKHFAAYDIEGSRTSFDAQVSYQDLSEYYLPPFQSCVRDAKVASVMCSYNSVNGIPSCANKYLLQTVLRDYWGFGEDRWVTSDCDAIKNVYTPHNYTQTYAEAVAVSLKAGTDIDCGSTYATYLPDAFNQSLITRADLETALVRQYTSLVRYSMGTILCKLGYFDPASSQPYRQLTWADVNTPSSQALAHRAAVEGIVLLKNTGVLPFASSIKKLALVGPWANATIAMQGNYHGVAPFLISPLQGAIDAGYEVTFVQGTDILGNTTDGFTAAIQSAQDADAVVFVGGIDLTVEKESGDRSTIVWPGNQLDLIAALEVRKPLVVVQCGGGQVDDSALKASDLVNAILWAGYPGQSGGTAIFDIISGKVSPSGRLPITQYPASYTSQIKLQDMTLRPSSTSPGRTYKWYQGTPVYEFGYGLHYTSFNLSWEQPPSAKYSLSQLIAPAKVLAGSPVDLIPLDTFHITVANTGSLASDYVALLFANSTSGPAPYPNKQLVSYTRVHAIQPGTTSSGNLTVTLGAIARADEQGNLWVHNGTYQLNVDVGPTQLTHRFELVGESVQISIWPTDPSA